MYYLILIDDIFSLKINENEHEMLGDEKEEKQDKFPDKNSPERC